MGKGAYEGSFKNFFFFWVTYSCVFKKQKCSNRLAIAAFLKSAAIGPAKRKCTGEASKFLVVLPITAFLKKRSYSLGFSRVSKKRGYSPRFL